MTTPTIHSPPTPSEYLLSLYHSGRKQQAKQLESECRAADPSKPLASIACEEWLDQYIGMAPSVLALKEDIRKLAIVGDSVLISGPTGTGKELIAHALHGSRNGKFVGVNCTALPSELIESELFGHKKGSFTGAVADRRGAIQEAWGGTLFLDEIGDMPLLMQSKLLRVLQEREYRPLGGDEVVKMECRIVAATNREVEWLLNGEGFRQDLYYRLATFMLKTVALAQRVEDLAELVDHLGGHELYTAYKDELHRFDLSGNVRSLQAQVRRWQVLGKL